jgi:hypothetical protein
MLPDDPAMMKRRGDVLDLMRGTQERYGRKNAKKLDAGVEPRNVNTLNPYVSARYMWMQIDDRYGVPVWLTADHMYKEVGKGVAAADEAIRSVVQARHTAGITKADDDMIADYLYGDAAVREKLAADMSPNALMLAQKEDELLQGYVANEMKAMIAGRWIDTGKVPGDIKNYIPSDAAAEGYTKRVLAEAKAADDAGTLLEHVTTQEPWKSGLGIRKYYYMSAADKPDIVDDTLYRMGLGVFEAPPDKTNLPGTYSYDAQPRRGTPKRKTGSTLNNIYNKATRVSAVNRARKDMKILSERLQAVEMSDADKDSLNGMLNNLLRRSSIPKRGFAPAIKVKRAYWTVSFSPLMRPVTAIYRVGRNAGQNFAFAGYGMNMTEATKHAAQLSRASGRLHEYDPEMMKRMDAGFAANVSQRKSMWTEFYMQDTAKITQDFNRRALTNKAIGLLEQTGTAYMAVDEFNRKSIWMTQYQVVKSAMQDYTSGKITADQFYNRTRLDTVARPQQLLMHDLISQGRVDDVAELSADWLTEDTNMKYKTAERSLIEQSPEERVFFGPLTFNRGRLEHGYYRGIKAMMDGYRSGDYHKAYRGASNIVKGVSMSAAVSAAMLYITGKRAYGLLDQFSFGLLDPGTSRISDSATTTFYNMYRYSMKEQSFLDTVDNIAATWSETGEFFLIPFSIEMGNVYESVAGKGDTTVYRTVMNGVAAKLGFDPKEYKTVDRTTREKVVHALTGAYERAGSGKKTTGRSSRAGRPSRSDSD